MHELSIAENILNTVRAEATRHGGGRATKVGLRLGEFSGVEQDSLSFCFEALVKGSDLEPLELEIERVRQRNRCGRCETEFDVVDFEIACPKCGALETRCVAGDEMQLTYLEMEEV
jgi:hydrogenase nickel incorporation protein HypA/HybF